MIYLSKMFVNDTPRTNELLRIVAKLNLRPCIVTAQAMDASYLNLIRAPCTC